MKLTIDPRENRDPKQGDWVIVAQGADVGPRIWGASVSITNIDSNVQSIKLLWEIREMRLWSSRIRERGSIDLPDSAVKKLREGDGKVPQELLARLQRIEVRRWWPKTTLTVRATGKLAADAAAGSTPGVDGPYSVRVHLVAREHQRLFYFLLGFAILGMYLWREDIFEASESEVIQSISSWMSGLGVVLCVGLFVEGLPKLLSVLLKTKTAELVPIWNFMRIPPAWLFLALPALCAILPPLMLTTVCNETAGSPVVRDAGALKAKGSDKACKVRLGGWIGLGDPIEIEKERQKYHINRAESCAERLSLGACTSPVRVSVECAPATWGDRIRLEQASDCSIHESQEFAWDTLPVDAGDRVELEKKPFKGDAQWKGGGKSLTCAAEVGATVIVPFRASIPGATDVTLQCDGARVAHFKSQEGASDVLLCIPSTCGPGLKLASAVVASQSRALWTLPASLVHGRSIGVEERVPARCSGADLITPIQVGTADALGGGFLKLQAGYAQGGPICVWEPTSQGSPAAGRIELTAAVPRPSNRGEPAFMLDLARDAPASFRLDLPGAMAIESIQIAGRGAGRVTCPPASPDASRARALVMLDTAQVRDFESLTLGISPEESTYSPSKDPADAPLIAGRALACVRSAEIAGLRGVATRKDGSHINVEVKFEGDRFKVIKKQAAGVRARRCFSASPGYPEIACPAAACGHFTPSPGSRLTDICQQFSCELCQ